MTSNEPARTPARLGAARLGATRLGFIPEAKNIVIDPTTSQPLYAWSQVSSPAEPSGPPNSLTGGYTLTRS